VDEYLPIMDRLSAMVDGIEERLLDENPEHDEAILDSLFHLKHELTALRRLAVPLREVISVLMRPTTRLVPEESAAYYDDVRDHLIRVVDMIDTMRDYLMDSLKIYTTQQTRRNTEETRRVNQSVARLTAVATIFLPLTFITGVYGMNFEYMPETQWQYGFYAILGLCVVLGIGMLLYLRRKNII
jgi:magnesium transporter